MISGFQGQSSRTDAFVSYIIYTSPLDPPRQYRLDPSLTCRQHSVPSRPSSSRPYCHLYISWVYLPDVSLPISYPSATYHITYNDHLYAVETFFRLSIYIIPILCFPLAPHDITDWTARRTASLNIQQLAITTIEHQDNTP